MSDFNTVLLSISDALGNDGLDKMKFLCQYLGRKRLENIDSGFKLFQELMQRNKLGQDNTEHLKQLLTDIKREDLAEKLKNYESRSPGPPTDLPDYGEQAKLNTATTMIVAQLGRKWRMFGRRLGLSEAQLDGVVTKHPSSLEDQVMEALTTWRRGQGAKARAEDLVEALRACDQNYTADLVQKELDKSGGGGGGGGR